MGEENKYSASSQPRGFLGSSDRLPVRHFLIRRLHKGGRIAPFRTELINHNDGKWEVFI